MNLGLIGGVSPYAYSNIYLNICREYRKRHEHYPTVVSYSINVSEQEEISFITNDVKDKAEGALFDKIKAACDTLVKSNAEAVGICCNSLSGLFLKACNDYNLKEVFSPLTLLNQKIGECSNSQMLILGTGYTMEHREEKHIVQLSEKERAELEVWLQKRISGENTKEDVLNGIISNYYDLVDYIVLACTDIDNYIIDVLYQDKIIDSSKLFVDKCVRVMDSSCVEY